MYGVDGELVSAETAALPHRIRRLRGSRAQQAAEALAVLEAVRGAEELRTRGRGIRVYCDNRGVTLAILKGRGKGRIGSMVARIVHLLKQWGTAELMFVKGVDNPADGPSRLQGR